MLMYSISIFLFCSVVITLLTCKIAGDHQSGWLIMTQWSGWLIMTAWSTLVHHSILSCRPARCWPSSQNLHSQVTHIPIHFYIFAVLLWHINKFPSISTPLMSYCCLFAWENILKPFITGGTGSEKWRCLTASTPSKREPGHWTLLQAMCPTLCLLVWRDTLLEGVCPTWGIHVKKDTLLLDRQKWAVGCPQVFTLCPITSTLCPQTITLRPQTSTQWLQTYTLCPQTSTQCPPNSTLELKVSSHLCPAKRQNLCHYMILALFCDQNMSAHLFCKSKYCDVTRTLQNIYYASNAKFHSINYGADLVSGLLNMFVLKYW